MDPLELILWATHSGTIKHHKYLIFAVKAWVADLEKRKKKKYYAPEMKCSLHFPLQWMRAGQWGICQFISKLSNFSCVHWWDCVRKGCCGYILMHIMGLLTYSCRILWGFLQFPKANCKLVSINGTLVKSPQSSKILLLFTSTLSSFSKHIASKGLSSVNSEAVAAHMSKQ